MISLSNRFFICSSGTEIFSYFIFSDLCVSFKYIAKNIEFDFRSQIYTKQPRICRPCLSPVSPNHNILSWCLNDKNLSL